MKRASKRHFVKSASDSQTNSPNKIFGKRANTDILDISNINNSNNKIQKQNVADSISSTSITARTSSDKVDAEIGRRRDNNDNNGTQSTTLQSNSKTDGDMGHQGVISCDINETALYRNLISTIHIHPNLLLHSDFHELRDFLKLLGVIFACDTTDICIPLGAAGETIGPLQPSKSKGEVPFLMSFGFIREMHLDPIRKVVTITDFRLTDSMKKILKKTLYLLNNYPQILYTAQYLFLYEFLIRFGVSPIAVSNFVDLRRDTNKLSNK